MAWRDEVGPSSPGAAPRIASVLLLNLNLGRLAGNNLRHTTEIFDLASVAHLFVAVSRLGIAKFCPVARLNHDGENLSGVRFIKIDERGASPTPRSVMRAGNRSAHRGPLSDVVFGFGCR